MMKTYEIQVMVKGTSDLGIGEREVMILLDRCRVDAENTKAAVQEYADMLTSPPAPMYGDNTGPGYISHD